MAYPGTVLRGRVESIPEGPERDVTVARRVPVKIVIDEPPDPERPLAAGRPVVATVVVR
jgi:hypothetical protein